MLFIRFTVDSNQLALGIDKIMNAITESVQATVEQAGQETVSGAKSIVVVDTGRLKNSLAILEQGVNYVDVGTNIEYAGFVEFGTRFQVAQPYFTPQINHMKTRLPEIFRQQFLLRL